MKSLALPFACLLFALALPVAAQIAALPADQSPLKIIQTEEAVFPRSLANTYVLTGDAAIAIDVDQQGRLTDWLVTAYSRKEFADSAVEALQQWRYEPPRLDGQPWSSVMELHFDYSRTGVVVNMTGMDMIANRMDELAKAIYVYRSHSLRELDRIPTPVKVVSPVSPALAPGKDKLSVTVEFYIDEEGRVRLPSVSRTDAGTVYAAAALAAVRQWRFEPPLLRGRPVLVLVRQEFKFLPQS
jgi:TonB family protein